MNTKDQRVLEKIRQHIDSILRYCQGCRGLEEFQSNTMLVEAISSFGVRSAGLDRLIWYNFMAVPMSRQMTVWLPVMLSASLFRSARRSVSAIPPCCTMYRR